MHVCVHSWEGSGVNEVGKDKATGVVRVKINPKYYRPTEVVGASVDLFTCCTFNTTAVFVGFSLKALIFLRFSRPGKSLMADRVLERS